MILYSGCLWYVESLNCLLGNIYINSYLSLLCTCIEDEFESDNKRPNGKSHNSQGECNLNVLHIT